MLTKTYKYVITSIVASKSKIDGKHADNSRQDTVKVPFCQKGYDKDGKDKSRRNMLRHIQPLEDHAQRAGSGQSQQGNRCISDNVFHHSRVRLLLLDSL